MLKYKIPQIVTLTPKKPTKTCDFSGFLAAISCIVVGLPENKLL